MLLAPKHASRLRRLRCRHVVLPKQQQQQQFHHHHHHHHHHNTFIVVVKVVVLKPPPLPRHGNCVVNAANTKNKKFERRRKRRARPSRDDNNNSKQKKQLFGTDVSSSQIARLNDEVKSLAVSSEETQVLNREHHIEGFVAISDRAARAARFAIVRTRLARRARFIRKGIGCIVDVTKRRRSLFHTRVEL